MSSLYIDGDIFVIEDGLIERFVAGRSDGWEPGPPGDELLREAPVYTLIASGSDKRTGLLYAYDPGNGRIVALDKASGDYVEQYRPAGGVPAWGDLRGMFVKAGVEGDPDVLYWIDGTTVYETVLEAVPDEAPASPTPLPSGSGVAASGDPAASAPGSAP
jgi:hypothetical protein